MDIVICKLSVRLILTISTPNHLLTDYWSPVGLQIVDSWSTVMLVNRSCYIPKITVDNQSTNSQCIVSKQSTNIQQKINMLLYGYC